MTRILVILAIAFQPVLLLGASSAAPAQPGVSSSCNTCCATKDCCKEVCPCEAEQAPAAPLPDMPAVPVPDRVRSVDSIESHPVLPLPAFNAVERKAGLSPMPVPPRLPGESSARLSLLCLWLT